MRIFLRVRKHTGTKCFARNKNRIISYREPQIIIILIQKNPKQTNKQTRNKTENMNCFYLARGHLERPETFFFFFLLYKERRIQQCYLSFLYINLNRNSNVVVTLSEPRSREKYVYGYFG